MAKNNTSPEQIPEQTEEDLVTIRLPITPGREKQEARYVGVNGRSWVIPRGIQMQVPRCVVEVLEHSEEAALEAFQYQQAHNLSE